MSSINQKSNTSGGGGSSNNKSQYDLATKGFYWICAKCRQKNSNYMNRCTGCNHNRDPLSAPSSSIASNAFRGSSAGVVANTSKLATNPKSSKSNTNNKNLFIPSSSSNVSRFSPQSQSSSLVNSRSNSVSLKSRHGLPNSAKSGNPQLSSGIGKPPSRIHLSAPTFGGNKSKILSNKSSNHRSVLISNNSNSNNTSNIASNDNAVVTGSKIVSRMRSSGQPLLAELPSTGNNVKAFTTNNNNNQQNANNNSKQLPEEISIQLRKIVRPNCTPYSNGPISKTCQKLLSLKHLVENEMKNYKRLLAQYRSEPFRDQEFITNRSSLYLLNEDCDEQYDRLIAKWLRIEEVRFDVINNGNASQHSLERTKSNGTRIGNSVQASQGVEMCVRNSSSNFYDFKQGKLGNCWLICSLACLLREHSNMLAQIIPDSHLHNREGIYQVLLCISGKWTPILIDDYFPCDSYGQLVFSQPLGRQLFAPIIEKALAKYHSCYKALTAGSTLEGFSTLTGMPCYQISLKNGPDNSDDKIWKEIWQNLKIDHYLLASSCVSDNDGLLSHHAYSLFNMVVIDNFKALLIWNPWGDNKLKGNLLSFHQYMSKKTGYKAISGTFWINYVDFLRYFSQVDVCKYQKWNCKRFQLSLPFDCHDFKNFTVFQLTVKKSTRFELTLYQEIHRDLEFKYRLSLNVVVFRCLNDKNQSIRLVECSPRIDTNVSSFSQNLPSGKYLVAIVGFNHWGTTSRLKDAPNLVLCFHASKSFEVKPINADLHLLGDMLIEIAIRAGQTRDQVKQRSGTKVGSQSYNRYTLEDKQYCFFASVCENLDPESYLVVKTDCLGSSNSFSSRSEDKTLDVIPPMCRQICILLARECDKDHCSYKCQTESFSRNVSEMKWNETGFHPDCDKMSALYAPRKIAESLSDSGNNRQSICSICV